MAPVRGDACSDHDGGTVAGGQVVQGQLIDTMAAVASHQRRNFDVFQSVFCRWVIKDQFADVSGKLDGSIHGYSSAFGQNDDALFGYEGKRRRSRAGFVPIFAPGSMRQFLSAKTLYSSAPGPTLQPLISIEASTRAPSRLNSHTR